MDLLGRNILLMSVAGDVRVPSFFCCIFFFPLDVVRMGIFSPPDRLLCPFWESVFFESSECE